MKTKRLGSLTFKIDRPKGFVKAWKQPGGWTKTFEYPCDYGFFPGRTGEDGEGLDAFVGDAPDGHFEVFQKLKPDADGRMVLDETKFLVGVTDRERETIYGLYGGEVWGRRVFDSAEDLAAHLDEFHPRRKGRYGAGIDGVAKQARADALAFYGVNPAEEISRVEDLHRVWDAHDRKPQATHPESAVGQFFDGGSTG